MKRQEEIKQAARISADRQTNMIGDWAEHRIGFIFGAEWADAHPDIDVRTMAAWRGGYKEAIEKACDWLYEYNRKQADKMFGTVHTADVTINVAQFRKAMEGGAE